MFLNLLWEGSSGGGGVSAPTAAFHANTVSGVYPAYISFINDSTGAPTSYEWYVNGNLVSVDANPSLTFLAAGVFTVRLVAANSGGSDDEIKTDYITITAPPTGTGYAIQSRARAMQGMRSTRRGVGKRVLTVMRRVLTVTPKKDGDET